MLLSRDRAFTKELHSFMLCKFLFGKKLLKFLCSLSNNQINCLHYSYKKNKLSNNIKFFNLHYYLFTPKLRFIYSIKRIVYGFNINSPPDVYTRSKYSSYLTQELKNIILAKFCCLYILKGGVLC